MALADFVGGAAAGASNNISGIQGVISGQTANLQNFTANLQGLSFLVAKGSGPFSQPGNPLSQLSGFAFDYYGQDDFEVNIDATDHWAEDNSAIQDHASVGPIIATLSGYVGEFVIPNPTHGVGGALRQLELKMQSVGAYAGKYTPGTVQAITGKITGVISTAQGYLSEVSQYAQQAQNILAMFKAASPTRQMGAAAILLAAAYSRQTFTLMTPWFQAQNVMITSVKGTQDDVTASKSQFSITVKQIRTVPVASQVTPTSVKANSQGRAGFQNQPQQVIGTGAGAPADFSGLQSSFNGYQ